MPLTLVTGPANSAKAQVVLDRYRAALPREPLLVVPRAADAEHYRRELAETGATLGVRVEAFSGLMREIATRAGLPDRPLGEHARAALLRQAVTETRLDVLAPAARSPGFAPALTRLIAELTSRRIEPPRFTQALRAWAGESRRRDYADELAALYAAYRRRLERLDRRDRELHDRDALDQIALRPDRWGATPVFCYGFDDLDPLQLDTIETLARRVGAPVTLSLPGEPGRVALAGRAATLETLRPLAHETLELPASAEYYESPALHHLERTLFEDGAAQAPAGAVCLLEGGDERAEAELVAHAISGLLADGFEPGDVAIVTRGATDVLAEALTGAGVPVAVDRRDRLDSSVTGRALLALLRIAAGEGEVEDLVACLGAQPVIGPREAFEARLRRHAIRDLRTARRIWESEHGPLRLPATLDEVEAELDRLLGAASERRAALIDPWEAAAAVATRRALGELRELSRSDSRAVGGLAGIVGVLAAVRVELPRATAGVTICDPLSLRARRVRVLFVYGTQEISFPAPPREESFLGSAERAELAASSGLKLGAATDHFAAERYLFYALCSRPTARLYVSWHDAGDAGDATPASLFVDELRDCFDASLAFATRPAGALGWPGDRRSALLAKRRRRAPTIVPLARPQRLAELKARSSHSASGIESWAGCPVAWLMEHGLQAHDLEPAPIYLTRGAEAHRVLAEVFGGLDGRRLDSRTLPMALELLETAFAHDQERLSPDAAMNLTERHRLRAELRRYLDYASTLESSHVPGMTELGFGLERAEHEAVELAPGLALCGRIDRVDLDAEARTAIVYDYKSSSGEPVGAWRREGNFQVALYMLVAERLLGVEAVGGLYQPLRADLTPRGVMRDDTTEADGLAANDLRDAPGLRAVLEERLAAAVAVAGEIDRGELEPRPSTCGREGCRYPALCRIGAR